MGMISGKTDSFAVVFTLDRSKNLLNIVGITEVVKDSLDPSYSTHFTVDYHFECVQEFVVRIYNCEGQHSTDNLQKHTLIGESNFVISNLMRSHAQKLNLEFGGKYKGKIIVKGEPVANTRDNFCVTFSANKLSNKEGFFSTSDPFLVISRLNEDSTYTAVWKNAKIDSTLNPRWAPVKISMARLCNGDIERPLRIEIWDWEKNGKHNFMGVVDTSVRQMLNLNGAPMPVIEPEKKAKKKSYVNSGTLVAADCSIEHNPTFADYITGDCKITLVAALDFTASNGDPNNPQSLHFITNAPGMYNPYQSAISSVCSIVEPYDNENKYTVYGFGAKLKMPNGQYSPAQHCFPVYGGGSEVNGVAGIQQAYKDCLFNVMLSGPTLFAPLITATAAKATSLGCCQANQKYLILLIITDGVVNDLNETKAAIIAASKTPMSIIIVGVGNADFSEMSELDSDKALLSHNGQTAVRDIVQFVSFNESAKKGPTALAADVLAEIPNQLLSYMLMNKIVPNPKI